AGLAGLEVLYGVPGTVGGAVVMNAGTRNGCVADILESVTLVGWDGSVRDASAAELGLSYRRSALQEQQGDVFVARAVFRLRPEDPAAIRERIACYAEARRASQPLDWRSCGCMFRNPQSDSAGRLIDAAGLKGLREGGAQVSDRHANFIVVSPGATASDVRRLAEKVRRLVQERHGVTLEYEVKLLGEWPDE
ncbi:MAG: UDP-N-acetylmuramate dehydrogenase, partial [Armatimonadota bacterium]